MTRASGQSMVEFSAGVAVLGMLTLGTISVAGLQEVQRRGIIAAREAARRGNGFEEEVALRRCASRSHARTSMMRASPTPPAAIASCGQQISN